MLFLCQLLLDFQGIEVIFQLRSLSKIDISLCKYLQLLY